MAVAALRPATRARFTCAECGAAYPKWEGRCQACEAWNSLVEDPAGSRLTPAQPGVAGTVHSLAKAAAAPERLGSGFVEVDRVLGAGIVPGSVVLLGGDPGVGKSTLALQIAARIAGGASLYCSGEESAEQVALRARRIGSAAGVELLVETDLDTIVATVEAAHPRLAVVDSVQTVYDAAVSGVAGSPAQVRAAVARLVATAKRSGVAVLLVGHVTKEGAIAGPRTLEHMVDVVLYLEGDRLGDQRLLRGVKNRFGSTGELGLLAMDAGGMADMAAGGRAFLDGPVATLPGSARTVTCDGLRPLAVEMQALTMRSPYGLPRRTASGFELNRLHVLLAVLEKRARVAVGDHDVFLNAAGGIRVDDPAADLAVALAIAGSRLDRTLSASCAVIGEVGLGGEVRRVGRLDARVAEAAAAGFDLVITPEQQARPPAGVSCRSVATLGEAVRLLA
ncbi:MAG: DNA repair protein RadA [Candidatus Dormibacteraeota bacterium]|nr:DNA repair protein RadA [Candidatus Dormibacteraeota bacterium]MBV9525761.1 DNA repair protein RadA [Candidatus Dormibacteraeota bacterium]